MKNLLTLLIIIGTVFSISAWKPLFIGHRGGGIGVSNTAECFQKGIDEFHYDGLECDVRVTSDKKYVICHDETTTSLGGSLTVANSTLEELKAETLTQTRNSVKYTGKICTVEEYLDICAAGNAIPLMELKWTTGINSSDMTNFPGLMDLITAKGLQTKVIFLTSMYKSLEYIRTNYPSVKCQYLLSQDPVNKFDWCKQWRVNPSVQAGYFDINGIKKFHDEGLEVAVWTVNTSDNYKKYGNMGVYMMTCDNLYGDKMVELEDIDWDNIPGILNPLKITVTNLWERSANKGNLPQDFPLGGSGKYNSAQQAGMYKGVFYTNDYNTKTLIKYDKDCQVGEVLAGTPSHGITMDDGGNLIQRNDGINVSPTKLRIAKAGTTDFENIDFALTNDGTTNFIFSSGDIYSEDGGYVYLYPNAQKVIQILSFKNGKLIEVLTSKTLTAAGTTAGVVIPIDNDPNHFVYQVRSTGYYMYNQSNLGDYLNGTANSTSPKRNSSLGGAYINMDGHELLIHGAGANYNGGFAIKDMSANQADLAYVGPLGDAKYAGNPSTGTFMKTEMCEDGSYNLYTYCMGNGYAAYNIALEGQSSIEKLSDGIKITSVFPNPSADIVNVSCTETIKEMKIYSLSGTLMRSWSQFDGSNVQIDISDLSNGIYILRINNVLSTKLIKK